MSEAMNAPSNPTKTIWDILKIGQQMNGNSYDKHHKPEKPKQTYGYPRSVLNGGMISIQNVMDYGNIGTETSDYHSFDVNIQNVMDYGNIGTETNDYHSDVQNVMDYDNIGNETSDYNSLDDNLSLSATSVNPVSNMDTRKKSLFIKEKLYGRH